MTPRRTRFYLDKLNAKWSGVCAGISDYTGVDVTLIRIATVALTLFTGFMWVFVYWATAWVAPRKPIELYDRTPEQKKFWQGVRANPKRMARDVRSKFRDIDRRLADIEAYVTSSTGSLSREIEKLR